MIAPPLIPARTPPHAPFRAGAPRFVPALKPIAPADWLAPDTEAHVLDWKRAMLDRPDLVHRAEPGSEAAAHEAADLVGRALGAPVAGDLIKASRLVSDDLVIMTPGAAGWTCAALTLTAPTFFAIEDVIGRNIAALHGPVPDAARLSTRIERVFEGLQPGTVLERFNWTLQAGADRFTPDAAPLRARALRADREAWRALLHLRVERQTIVKLRETGAVLFTIRVCLDPVAALQHEDRASLAAAWRTLGPEGRAYKGWADYEGLAAAAFKAWGV
ncbi:MAG: DUF3445 domain-containing protein [Alphaproteobacteria bacterium]|nr:DUF3445 domain-containing protein [Alphaproteobacteria bacterium]